jgi:CheY-like chemotaxis protein
VAFWVNNTICVVFFWDTFKKDAFLSVQNNYSFELARKLLFTIVGGFMETLITGNTEKKTKTEPVDVLFVDDSESTLNMYKLMGQRLGFNVFLANSARAALKTLAENPGLSIMFLDIQMPEVDGHKLTEFIDKKFNLRELKICYLSRMRTKKDVAKGLKNGVTDFIFKPVVMEDLKDKVNQFKDDLFKIKSRYFEGSVRMPVDVKYCPFEVKDVEISKLNEKFLTLKSKLPLAEKELLSFRQDILATNIGHSEKFVFEGFIEEVTETSGGYEAVVTIINLEEQDVNNLRSFIMKLES